jgi:hypothetical protein
MAQILATPDPTNTCTLSPSVTELYESAPHMLASDRDIFEIALDACHLLQSKATL